jgi:hypothetical protein
MLLVFMVIFLSSYAITFLYTNYHREVERAKISSYQQIERTAIHSLTDTIARLQNEVILLKDCCAPSRDEYLKDIISFIDTAQTPMGYVSTEEN